MLLKKVLLRIALTTRTSWQGDYNGLANGTRQASRGGRMKRAVLITIVAAIAASMPSLGSAEHISDTDSRTIHETNAVALWHFDEPDGGYSHFSVSVTEQLIVALATGERDSTKQACFNFYRLVPGHLGELWSGCKPLSGGEFQVASRLSRSSLNTLIPVQCVFSPDCGAPDSVTISLSWTASGPLERVHFHVQNEMCARSGWDEIRPVTATGSISDGLNELTRGEQDSRFILRHTETVRLFVLTDEC